MSAYSEGYYAALQDVVKLLKDYSDEARADKRYQGANYLKAATHRVSRLSPTTEKVDTV